MNEVYLRDLINDPLDLLGLPWQEKVTGKEPNKLLKIGVNALFDEHIDVFGKELLGDEMIAGKYVNHGLIFQMVGLFNNSGVFLNGVLSNLLIC